LSILLGLSSKSQGKNAKRFQKVRHQYQGKGKQNRENRERRVIVTKYPAIIIKTWKAKAIESGGVVIPPLQSARAT